MKNKIPASTWIMVVWMFLLTLAVIYSFFHVNVKINFSNASGKVNSVRTYRN